VKVVQTQSGLATILAAERAAGRTIGFVPTMGALHDGHLSLVRAARAESDVVVLSIFVNPLQFGPGEDFRAYPRDEKRDLRLADEAGVDVVFLPLLEEMEPEDRSTTVSAGPLGELVEGAARPGHFDGVATVVARLFNQVRPDKAFFGQKDAQQVAVLRRMVRDLAFPVELVACPTVREESGLALSSRNAYLSDEDRDRASLLYRALESGRSALGGGGGPAEAEKAMQDAFGADPQVALDYARAVDPDTFEEPHPGRPVLLVVAARVGRARLIDNLVVT
jgi:pantoate--beta-alanine ligase